MTAAMHMATVKETVDAYLSEQFLQYPLSSYPQLETFHPAQGLKPLAKPNLTANELPLYGNANEDNPIPILLLHSLQTPVEAYKHKAVYKYIEEAKRAHPSALYGTSGAGKTRSVFEYLSHNKGLYLLAKTSKRDPGSADFDHCFLKLGEDYLERFWDSQDDQKKEEISKANYRKVLQVVNVLVYVRCMVHHHVTQNMNREPSPFEWLLLQLYPKNYFGCDIFMAASNFCMSKVTYSKIDLNSAKDAVSCIARHTTWMQAIFVDEAQALLHRFDEQYFLSSQGATHTHRTADAFSAVWKAFNKSIFPVHPCFAGTRMSFDLFTKESTSASAKLGNVVEVQGVFMEFEQLDAPAVLNFLQIFLDLTDVDDSVKIHVSKWLQGRPRWAACFVERYLVKTPRDIASGTRSAFNNDGEKVLLQALDRFIAKMTRPASGVENDRRRNSFPTEDRTSAISTFKRVMDQRGKYSALNNLEKLVFEYAITGAPVVVKEEYKLVIENGLAAVHAVDVTTEDPDGFQGVLDEPLIIEAGINYFCHKNLLKENMDHQSDKGIAFEKIMLPYLQKNLQAIISEQLTSKGGGAVFQSFGVSVKSSYGVLAKCCKGDVQATLDWIRTATTAKIEGTYPPFCYPDDLFGADVMFFLWNDDHTEFRVVLCQAKYSKKFPQPHALNTLVPDWLYFNNKGGPEINNEGSQGQTAVSKRKTRSASLLLERDNGSPGQTAVSKPNTRRTTRANGVSGSNAQSKKRKSSGSNPQTKTRRLNDEGSGKPSNAETAKKSQKRNSQNEKAGISELNSRVPKEIWAKRKVELIKSNIPCLRLMVQYPMPATRTAKSGQKYHQNSNKACTDPKCKKNHDWLVTVDYENAAALFDNAVATLVRNRP